MGKAYKSYADYRLAQNMIEFEFYHDSFKRLLLTMIEWKGLPDGMSQRFIEDHREAY